MERLALIGSDTLLATLDDIAAGVEPTPQPVEGVTLAPKVLTEDARVDWARPTAAVYALIRGVTPAPGAWSMLDDARLKVLRARPAHAPGLVPGELLASKRALLVGTSDGALELVLVQDVGKPAMSGADWARGARLEPGARLA